MNSDSESQDSDDGRRFRLETTRRDSQSQPQISAKRSRKKCPSRYCHSRENGATSRHSLDGSLTHQSRSSNERQDKKKESLRRQHREIHIRHHTEDHRVGNTTESKKHGEHWLKRKLDKNKRRSNDRSSKCSHVLESNKKMEDNRSRSHSLSLVEVVTTVVPSAAAMKQSIKPVKNEDETVTARKERATSNSGCGSYNSDVDVISDGALMTDINNFAVFNSYFPSSPTCKKPRSFYERVVNKSPIEDDAVYGPALPPKLEKRCYMNIETHRFKEGVVVQVGKSKNVIPTVSPANIKTMRVQENCRDDKGAKEKQIVEDNAKDTQYSKDDINTEDVETELFGPALPPCFQKTRTVRGPALPDNFSVPLKTDGLVDVSKSNIKKNEENDYTDDNIIGPLPANHLASKDSYIQLQLEYRAQKVKEKFMDTVGPEKKNREEWMVKLPPAHAVALGLGLIPRKFKTHEGPDMSDRSVWTDTPADKVGKQKEENHFVPSKESNKKAKIPAEDKRDQGGETESLLDIHLKMKKKKKKAAKESEGLTRRPFDRDLDLQFNRQDKAEKKFFFDKARKLNDKFTPGKI
ncbi:GPALPP motifs-containing protein 1 [Copidosoma floridanum]|uniref:GPALPP motifs-containing protein 1 n=1 Tax=Copidosoma floridanum TaxID=29053 RepID=UPI0006C99D89|nr:GPALPP motifs-containing protein 1 [Copidosoma floridanum]